VPIAREVLPCTASPVGKFRWDLLCLFLTKRHWIFEFFVALSFGRALRSYSPFDWLAKKPRFHEKPVERLGSFMVALPTRAYVGVSWGAVESYGMFSTGFGLVVGTESTTLQ